MLKHPSTAQRIVQTERLLKNIEAAYRKLERFDQAVAAKRMAEQYENELLQINCKVVFDVAGETLEGIIRESHGSTFTIVSADFTKVYRNIKRASIVKL